LNEKRINHKQLEKTAGEVKKKEDILEAAERALQILPYENQMKTAREDTDSLIKRKHLLKNEYELAVEKRNTSLKEYEQEEQRKTERENLKQEVLQLQSFLPKVEA